jgi:hypothetical protein
MTDLVTKLFSWKFAAAAVAIVVICAIAASSGYKVSIASIGFNFEPALVPR